MNIETSADSSGITCDIMVCLIVSSTLRLTSNWDRQTNLHMFLSEDGKCFFADVDALIEA